MRSAAYSPAEEKGSMLSVPRVGDDHCRCTKEEWHEARVRSRVSTSGCPRNTSDSGAEETECVNAGKARNVQNRTDAEVPA